MKKGNLMISNDGFSLEGKPLRILSGAIHYFRVPRDYWEDRLAKLRACGFNTVETYIPWNLHEPQEGVFEWEDERDFAAFALLAQRLGLHVILRPSPYICAEWEMGGVPWWLLKKPGLRLRCMNRPYPIPGRRLLCTLVLPEGDPMGDFGFAMRNFSTYSEICINYATPSVKEATLRVCNVALSM